jgi:D-lactate dehydrogenase
VVHYIPACVNRVLATDEVITHGKAPLYEVIPRVLERAGYQVSVPAQVDHLCCGLAFESKGFPQLGAQKAAEFLRTLQAGRAPPQTRYPHTGTTTTTGAHAQHSARSPLLLVDASPCAQYLRKQANASGTQVSLPDPAEVAAAAVHHLEAELVRDPVLEVCVHAPCSAYTRHGGQHALSVAERCAGSAFLSEVPCCGMAGDRGLRYPALPEAATAPLRNLLTERTREGERERRHEGARDDPETNTRRLRGVSTSTTCEIALSRHTPRGVEFGSLFHLLDDSLR